MSKLSEGLKALINAAHARPNTIPAPSNIKSIYARIAESAQSKSVGTPAWLSISTAATMTLNSPNSLLQLHAVASQPPPPSPSASTNSPSPSTLTPTSTSRPMTPVQAAELMREVGLKCISFNGIPRTINMLAAFHAGLPPTVSSQLSKTPTRQLTNTNAAQTVARGRALWDSIYRPFEDKLVDRLALSHPNLPVHIVSAHYGALLSDPEPNLPGVKVGRVLASLTAIACLRAQTGVAPQVLSHVFGLRKAFEDGSAQAEGEAEVEGAEWLAGEEGNVWVLERVDEIVAAIGASFAPGVGIAGEGFIKAKL